MKVPTAPFGRAIFADDLRHEAGNKVSAMGIYENEMVFPPGTPFPILIYRLGIIVHWVEPFDSYERHLVFGIEYAPIGVPPDVDGTPLGQITVDLPDNMEPSEEVGISIGIQIRPQLVIPPFVIHEASKVRVWVIRHGEKWGIGKLNILEPLPAPTDTQGSAG